MARPRSNLALHPYGPGEWRPPILKTVASSGQGVPELEAAIASFRAHGAAQQEARRKSRSAWRLRELVSQRFMHRLEREVLAAGEFDAMVDRIASRDLDPYSAASTLLARALDVTPPR